MTATTKAPSPLQGPGVPPPKTKNVSRKDAKTQRRKGESNSSLGKRNLTRLCAFAPFAPLREIFPLVFRHARVYLIRPPQNPACEIHQFSLITRSLKRVNRAGAAATHLAVNDRLAARIDFIHAIQHLPQRNVNRIRYAAIRDFIIFAHVYDLNIVAIIEALFEFCWSYLFHIVLPLVGLHYRS